MPFIWISVFASLLMQNSQSIAVDGSANTNRIVGGQSATATPVPYQISLQISGPSYVSTNLQHVNWLHWCGGAIIARRSVLTAAHCVHEYAPSRFSIWAGTPLLDAADGWRLLVHSFQVHYDYALLNSSDIAVVRTETPFVYLARKIVPIHFTDEGIEPGEDCVLTGWGYTHHVHHLRQPNELHRVVLPTISNDECEEHGMQIDSTSLCTLAPFGQGACAGDTGGPLVFNNRLVGIVTHGTGLCGIGLPDLYTRVSVFADWIWNNSE